MPKAAEYVFPAAFILFFQKVIKMREKSRSKKWVLLWLLPAVAVLAMFYIVPIFNVIIYSFSNTSFFGEKIGGFTFNSYKTLFSSKTFIDVIKTTGVFVLASVFFQLLFGFLSALAVVWGENKGLRISPVIVRTIILSAWVLPGVAVGIVWKMLLSEANYGILNYYIKLLIGEKIMFLSSPKWALFSVILANIWRGTAFSTIIQYGGLKQIPPELYEAAKIDGASSWKRLLYITIPQMKQMNFINLALITIYTFNTFDMIMALTGGGPGRSTEVLSLYIYDKVFGQWSLSTGAASAVVLLLINLIIVIFYYKAMKIGEISHA